jgi:BirA family biotin operon repressor/biotin-[acetyl-CoA-carboxylase] ligase
MAVSVRWLDRCESTQDVVHALAAEGAPAGLAIAAREQTSGRGSRRQQWSSPLGGLWLSYLWRPSVTPAAETLSIRVGLVVADALERLGIPDVGLKWPNDLIVRDRKVGGILCEARWQGDALGWVTVGIGLNVANAVPGEVVTRAMRLGDVKPGLTPERVAEPVVESLLELTVAAPELGAPERTAFARRDWLHGRTLSAPIAGTADGVADDGRLRVRRPDGTIELARTGPVELAVP